MPLAEGRPRRTAAPTLVLVGTHSGATEDRSEPWLPQRPRPSSGPSRPVITEREPERAITFVDQAVDTLTRWLARHSIDVLRISLGLVFVTFGGLKLLGISPAEELSVRTVEALTFGIVNGGVALVAIALVECFIGITLVTGRMLRTGLVVLGGAMVGIMSPLVLFFGDLFPGAPTLEAQYVLKDVVLVAAGLVVAAKALGARMITERAACGRLIAYARQEQPAAPPRSGGAVARDDQGGAITSRRVLTTPVSRATGSGSRHRGR